MPTRQTRVFVPSTEPTGDWAETLIGRVFSPLTAEFQRSLEWFWFSRYGGAAEESGDCVIERIPDEFKRPINPGGAGFHRSMRFRFSVSDEALAAFEQRAEELITAGGYRISDIRQYDHVADTGSNRFLGVENRLPDRPVQRAELVTNFYHAISMLIIDALVGPDGNGRYRMETNDDQNNNPRGSTFQSLLHLFCNMTDVPTDVYVFTKGESSLIGFGTFMYPPRATPPGGWETTVARYPIRYQYTHVHARYVPESDEVLKMQVSFDDAFSILSKWSEERTLVSALLRIGNSYALTKGFLSIDGPVAQIECVFHGEPCPGKIVLDFTGASFTYDDWRMAPTEQRERAEKIAESVIQADLQDGGACILYTTEE